MSRANHTMQKILFGAGCGALVGIDVLLAPNNNVSIINYVTFNMGFILPYIALYNTNRRMYNEMTHYSLSALLVVNTCMLIRYTSKMLIQYYN
jgi:hypothetical protein